MGDVVEHAYVPVPQLPGRPPGEWLRWGTQLDVHVIRGDGELTEDQVAAYVAKYATKSTEVVAGPDRPLRSERDLDVLPADTPAHIRAAVAAAWRLGGHPELAKLRLRAWAHLLGFRSHFATKSGAYSTTFTTLRQERAYWTGRHAVEQANPGQGERELDGEQGCPESVPGELPADQAAASGSGNEPGRAPGTTLVVGAWRFAGRGYTTPATRSWPPSSPVRNGSGAGRTGGRAARRRGPRPAEEELMGKRGNGEGVDLPAGGWALVGFVQFDEASTAGAF